MKKSLALFFVTALLISALTACGCSASPNNDAPANDTNMQDNTGTQSNDSAIVGENSDMNSNVTPDHTTPDDAQNSLEQGVDDIRDGIDNAVDDITGNSDASNGGVSYEQMLRNGRVKNGAFANDGTTSKMR